MLAKIVKVSNKYTRTLIIGWSYRSRRISFDRNNITTVIVHHRGRRDCRKGIILMHIDFSDNKRTLKTSQKLT